MQANRDTHNSRIARRWITPNTQDVLLGRYELRNRLGAGGMAEVYAAYDRLLERIVAVKLPRVGLADGGLERLRREAAAMASVDSPHVVGIHDIGTEGGQVFLVMQQVHGRTLEEEVQRFGPVEPSRACRIVADILVGLGAIHAGGLVHRDLKPSNVMLDRDDRAVLLDLGIAFHRRKQPLTPSGMVTGTPEFMAPEQMIAAPVDGRTDLYQVGLVLVYMLAGDEPDRELEDRLARLPPALAEIARRALAPIERRFDSAARMLEALAAAQLASAAVRTPAPLVQHPGATRTPHWTGWPTILATTAIVLALAAALAA